MSNYQFVIFSEKGSSILTPKDSSSSPLDDHIVTSPTSGKQLISQTDENKPSHNARRQIPNRALRKRDSPGNPVHQHQQQYQQDSIDNAGATRRGGKTALGKAKIPRPANAFMLFANEWRKKLASENPKESNKDISVRLGALWKNLEKHEKEKYFSLAREVDAEHKRKYPDYVYNPKEARLRKAMREQNRELSRQSMVSGPISSPDNSSTASSESTATSTNYNLSMTCSSTPLGQSSAYNPAGRINPWFTSMGHATAGEHVKQILPYRMMQAHQRTFDKTKEVLRKQVSLAQCSTGFQSSNVASCYSADYSHHHVVPPASQSNANQNDTRTNAGLESNDYCGIGEFTDGQKWHPYQNGSTGYHPRAGPMTKISSRHGMQPGWNQFCGLPMSSMPAQNPMIRGPRHMVMMQEQRERHCGGNFSEEISSMGYGKIDPRIAASASYSQSTYREPEKCIEDNSRWPPPPTPSLVMQSTDSSIEKPRQHPKTEESKDYDEDETQQQPEQPPAKQPLPGFHQAFGSTEIGRFSRSEFFTNMVSDNGLIPDPYFFPPVIPYPHKKPAAEDVVMPNDCYWFGPVVGIPVANVANPPINGINPSKYITFMELPSRIQRDWMHPRIIPQELHPVIERPDFLFHDNYSHFPVPEQTKMEVKKSSESDSSADRVVDSPEGFSGNDGPEKSSESDDNEDVEEDHFINVDDTD